jgi:hypothetical protein
MSTGDNVDPIVEWHHTFAALDLAVEEFRAHEGGLAYARFTHDGVVHELGQDRDAIVGRTSDGVVRWVRHPVPRVFRRPVDDRLVDDVRDYLFLPSGRSRWRPAGVNGVNARARAVWDVVDRWRRGGDVGVWRWLVRVCSYCGADDHNRDACPKAWPGPHPVRILDR